MSQESGVRSSFFRGLALGAIGTITLCIAAFVGLIVWMGSHSTQDLASDSIADEERRMGRTCAEVQSDFRSLVVNTIDPILDAGAKGEDWRSLVRPDTVDDLRGIEDDVVTCRINQGLAEDEGLEYPSGFDHDMALITGLRMTLAYSPSGPSISGRPGDFEALQELRDSALEVLQ